MSLLICLPNSFQPQLLSNALKSLDSEVHIEIGNEHVKNNSSDEAFNLFAIDNLDLSIICLAITPTLWILDGFPQHSN